jgi:hypothetical protein
MRKEVVLLEELAKHTDIIMNLPLEEASEFSEKCRRIKSNNFEIIYEIKIKKNEKAVQTEEQSEADDQKVDSVDKEYDPILAYNGIHHKDPIRIKESHCFLPYEREILNNVLSTGMKMFNINERLTINKDALFPSRLVKQCLGEVYNKTKRGDTFEAFDVLYNMNNTFCDGILLPVETSETILNITRYSNYSVMAFFDHFWEKETITLECCGQDTFKIVYYKNEQLMKGYEMVFGCEAHNDFYVGLNLISQEKFSSKTRRPTNIKYSDYSDKSRYKVRKVRYKDQQ